MLKAEGLRKAYAQGQPEKSPKRTSAQPEVMVFGDLSFTIAPGTSLALTGPSGSGKSTLLNILCGLEPLDSGNLWLFDKDATKFDSGEWARLRRRDIGVLFQDSNLMPALTLAENLRLRASLAGRTTAAAEDWLQRLGLAELAGRFPDQVSGGQRQRAALAMVFAIEPKLVLADEPTASLDRTTAGLVADELFRWQNATGSTLLLATHDQILAGRCDRRLDLAEGY